MASSARRVHVDANVILRFLLGTPASQAEAAKRIFDQAAEDVFSVVIHPAVLAEVIYVLTSPRLAHFARHEVADALRGLFALRGVEVADLDVTLRALRRFEASTLDWVDCLLLAYAPEIDVFSFDQAMVTAGARQPTA